jgi:hypothetical protein
MRLCSAVFMGCALTASVSVMAQERSVPLAYGIEVGVATEQEMFGSGPPSGVRMGMVRFQVIPSLFSHPGHRFESFQVVNEFSLMETLRPGKRFIFGPNIVFRPTVRLDERYRLFWDAGFGISSSSVRHEVVNQLNGRMQYQLRIGMGIRRRLSDGITASTAYNLSHLSNDGTTVPNPGLNMHTLVLGVTF